MNQKRDALASTSETPTEGENVESLKKEPVENVEKEPESPPSKKICPNKPSDDEGKLSTEEASAEVVEGKDMRKFKRGMIKEDPYIFLGDEDSDLASVREFYGISTELPSKHFLVRSTGATKKRHIYLVSEKVNLLMTHNKHLKIINTGVRVVTRSPFRAGKEEHGIEFRLVQDGLQLTNSFIKNRVVSVTLNDLLAIMTQHETKISEFDVKTQEAMERVDMGCVIWHYDVTETDNQGGPLTADLWLCGHKGRVMAQVMLNKEERKHYLRILGVPIPKELQIEVKGPGWGDKPSGDNVNEADASTAAKVDEIAPQAKED